MFIFDKNNKSLKMSLLSSTFNELKKAWRYNLFLTLASIFYFQFVNGQNVKVGATPAIPNASAMLDIDGITGLAQAKGLLIPRITNTKGLP